MDISQELDTLTIGIDTILRTTLSSIKVKSSNIAELEDGVKRLIDAIKYTQGFQNFRVGVSERLADLLNDEKRGMPL